jgi:GNAT superfamily N-acetyltransferase
VLDNLGRFSVGLYPASEATTFSHTPGCIASLLRLPPALRLMISTNLDCDGGDDSRLLHDCGNMSRSIMQSSFSIPMESRWSMSSPPTKIRPASPSDQRALLPLIEEYYKFDALKFDGQTIDYALQRLLRSRKLGRVWMIETAKCELAGYAILTYNYDLEFGGIQAIITEFFITEPYRRHSLGRRMIAALSNFCRKSGITTIELQVTRGNRRARRFYESLGFETLDGSSWTLSCNDRNAADAWPNRAFMTWAALAIAW